MSAVAGRLPGGGDRGGLARCFVRNLERFPDFGLGSRCSTARSTRPNSAHEERLLVKDAAAVAEKLDWSAEPWRALTDELKRSSGKKGRELFHPLRLALTGRESGPEMAGLVARMGKDRAIHRLEAAAKR